MSSPTRLHTKRSLRLWNRRASSRCTERLSTRTNAILNRPRGRVDIMYVRGTTADKLFTSAKELPGSGGRPILVPKPEHLIAMKVQAMKDAPERTWQDLVDIGFLFRL